MSAAAAKAVVPPTKVVSAVPEHVLKKRQSLAKAQEKRAARAIVQKKVRRSVFFLFFVFVRAFFSCAFLIGVGRDGKKMTYDTDESGPISIMCREQSGRLQSEKH